MWTRKQLKDKAKALLKKYFWNAVIVCLLFTIIGNLISTESIFTNNLNENNIVITNEKEQYIHPYEHDKVLKINMFNGVFDIRTFSNRIFPEGTAENNLLRGIIKIPVTTSTLIIISIFIIFLGVFIFNPLKIGLARFFLKSYEGDSRIGYLFSAFTDGTWFKMSIKLFIRDIYILLWFLLLFIPGIVKSYQYFYVEYILAENPELSISEALEISKKMTDGEKFDIFVLELSFIGWIFLANLLFNIGYILLNPYMYATYADLYLTKKYRSEFYYEENEASFN
ncbi:DUF975 family protein [Anaerosphaera multitolerans]|uniref:DUF975 family protein n=1 Tax=Anaerosphaera multitolerans TaxID=2487351 RepID=A0A437S9E1_9FIRM|nr:DUF975 family protein [Anaerosphaera multitolerans]RVU55733.1 DUF975 family protein [Anaerosphaera multitolerans]